VIPRTALQLDASLPPEHTGWTPGREDLTEEGFGGFRNTWLIRNIGVREAQARLEIEGELIRLADEFARDAEEFDAICSALENVDAEELPVRLQHPAVPETLAAHLEAGELSPTEGLDLGVAGLVYALAAVGCWTAASCRGHPKSYAFTDRPVVVLACDRHRASVLQADVEQSHCGLTTDGHREGLLAVEAESVEEMMAVARLVASHRKDFIPRRGGRQTAIDDQDAQIGFDFGPT
jgi:hypothetical protein